MALQRRPVDHSRLINAGTLTVNSAKDPPQVPIQDIRSVASSYSLWGSICNKKALVFMACGREIGDLPLLSDPLTSPFHGKQRDQSLSSHNPLHYLHLTFIYPVKEQGWIRRSDCSCWKIIHFKRKKRNWLHVWFRSQVALGWVSHF